MTTAEEIARLLAYARSPHSPAGTPPEHLLGIVSDAQSVAEMTQAIEAECERIDAEQW